MTKEEKQLLLKDLCARLQYGPKVWYPNGSGAISTVKGIVDDICYFNKNPKYGNFCCIETVKPYLRPMSSMTEKEIKIYHSYCECDDGDFTGEILYFDTIESFDYLTSIHIDYRGLIPMGLALEAKEGMYKIK